MRWLDRAKEDLLWARSSLKGKIYYGACFAAQQAVEKALKAYLISKGERLKKVHDLVMLVDEAKRFDADFEKFRAFAARLSQYYLETRYPDIADLSQSSEAETQEAVKFAEQFIEFVEKKLEEAAPLIHKRSASNP